jgi:hypothetical protein
MAQTPWNMKFKFMPETGNLSLFPVWSSTESSIQFSVFTLSLLGKSPFVQLLSETHLRGSWRIPPSDVTTQNDFDGQFLKMWRTDLHSEFKPLPI